VRLSTALAALLFASFARAGVAGRVGETYVPEGTSFKTGAAPAITLQMDPAAAVLAPSLTGALAPASLAPSVIPAAAAAKPGAIAAIPNAAPAAAKPIDALQKTGASLSKLEAASPAAAAELGGLYSGEGAKPASAEAVTADAVPAAEAPAARSWSLGPSRPAPAFGKRMPPGVKRAFQNSAVLGGGMAALSGALALWMRTLASPPNLETFAIVAFPLLLIPFHFALVSGFWASRYYGYPKLSETGKAVFKRAWQALSVLYPLAAVPALTLWALILGREPALALLFGMPFLVALGEVFHHFGYRLVSERKQDNGKSVLDWRSRLGGNIGQQLARMR
jgi:hypothetical protein